MEYVARRSCEVIQINEDAQEIYVDLKDQVENEIRETKEQIIKSKAQLEEATKHRKYSMEYDALAKLIESKPDRKMTEIKRMGLELELDTLRVNFYLHKTLLSQCIIWMEFDVCRLFIVLWDQKRQDKIDEQLDYRKRSIAMLGHSIEFLKDLMQVSEEKFTRKVAKSSRQRNGETPMDVDSTSQSEPPSPVVMEQIPEEATVNGSAMIVDLKPASNGTASNTPTPVESCDKSKSEKYEDLSESEGEENS